MYRALHPVDFEITRKMAFRRNIATFEEGNWSHSQLGRRGLPPRKGPYSDARSSVRAFLWKTSRENAQFGLFAGAQCFHFCSIPAITCTGASSSRKMPSPISFRSLWKPQTKIAFYSYSRDPLPGRGLLTLRPVRRWCAAALRTKRGWG